MSARAPDFEDGLLPPGDYPMTLDGLRASVLVSGPRGRGRAWDTLWRERLVGNLAVLVSQLWQVGIERIFIDGSFVEDKAHPNDIDGYFECDLRAFASGAIAGALNALDPYQIWTWDPGSRRPDPDSAKLQLPMWHRYRVELYPHFGQLSGVRDQFGNELQFPSAFRLARYSFRPKGIVQVVKQGAH